VNNLQKQLTGTWIKDKDGSIDRFGGKISFKGLVNGDSINIGIIDKPNDLIREELSVILKLNIGYL
jgi:hypothetical protein